MKIVVLGATGNIGSRFLTQAADAGHEVIAYARRPEAVAERPGVTVVGGSLDDTEALTAAATGADTVLCSITGTMRDGTFLQQQLPGILTAVTAAGVDRFVFISVFGAGDTADQASGFAKILYRTALKKFLDDRVAAEKLVTASGLDSTIVFPVNLKDTTALNDAAIKPLTDVAKVPGLPTLPMDDAAAALLTITTQDTYRGQRLLVTTPTGWRPRAA